MQELNTIQLGDCLDIMPNLPDGCIDMVMCDPPYGTTACKWDSIIPLEPMWVQLKRLIKPNGAIVMTASQPFTTTLIASNMKMFKYCWVWEKNTVTGFMQAKTKPLKSHEDVIVFGDFKMAAQYFKGVYNPAGIVGVGDKTYSNKRKADHITGDRKSGTAQSNTGYPKDVLRIDSAIKTVHPTQKPVALMEYLIKTYTNEGEVVLDFAIGSATTAVACIKTGRKYIGIEKEEKYYDVAQARIKELDKGQQVLF